MDATAGDTQDHGEAQDRPPARRTPRRRAPDAVPFWGADAKIPVIRQPSPVVGPAAPAAPPAPAAAPAAAPTAPLPPTGPMTSPVAVRTRPAPAPPAPAPTVAARPPALPDLYAVEEPLPRRRDPARDDGTRRIRPATALGAAGLLLLVAGFATPFLLSGPFGATPDAAPAPVPPAGTVTTYVPTVSGSAPAAVGTAASTTAPATTLPAGATDRPTAAASRTTARPGRTTPTARRTTVTATVTATPAPTTQASTRPGEVYVDPAQYVGRQEDPVRAELEARGLDTADSWAFDTGRPRGTVVEVRPSGWVRDGGDVRVYVAWS